MVSRMSADSSRTPPTVAIVSGAIFVAIAVAGWLGPGTRLRGVPGSVSPYFVHVLGLAVAFLLPAQRIREPTDVVRRWALVLPAIVGGTLVWDALMAWLVPRHQFLEGWWLVYPSSLVFFGLLLALHGLLVAWIGVVRARLAH